MAGLAAPILTLSAAAVRRRRRGRSARPWAWFGASTLLTAAGSVLAAGTGHAPDRLGLLQIVGNALFVAAVLATTAGFFTALQPGRRFARFWMGADLVLAIGGITALVGRLAAMADLAPMAPGPRTAMVVYGVSGIATMLFLVPLLLRIGRTASPALRLVGAACLVNALLNLGLLYAVAAGHPYHEGSWLSAGYQIGLVLLTLGGLAAARHTDDEPIALPVRRDRTMPLSVAAAATAVAALSVANLNFGHLHLAEVVTALVVAALLARLGLVAREHTRLADQLAAALADQRRLAVTDALTGLPNRRHFEQALHTEIARTRRHGRPLSLVILDLDHFKAINDTYGHPAGDAVLVQVAALLQQSTRGGDVIARFGGEEFVWLLPDTTEDGAVQMAGRLRTTLAAHPVQLPTGDVVTVTASLGAAADLLDAHALLTAADQTLYRAKAAGRNQVTARLPIRRQLPSPPSRR
ncbi:diguanylate cyclase [Cryptosporangium sp. NPDC048952]|uniref:GGDEF domain-containing protein n=1 Tax=Cryptosporangium sp. NPDC048952 TaxID=3363961 RepID=UPI00370FEC0F